VTSAQIAGSVLVAAGIFDLGLGFFFVGPRMPNARARRILQIAMVIGAVTLIGLGLAIFTGALGLARSGA
jgi:hypothetical protein